MEARRPQPARGRGICACGGDFLRWLLLLLLITACIGLAGMHWIQLRLDEVIRKHVESRFRAHYSELAVSIKSARRMPQGGIEIRGLSIADPSDPARPNLLAYIDELQVDCDTRLDRLLAPDREVRRLIVRRLVVNATHHSDGTWDTDRLLPLPKFGPRPPPLAIESGKVQIRAGSGPTQQRWGFHDLNVRVQPLIDTAAGSDPAAFPVLAIDGHFASDFATRIECRGQLDFTQRRWIVDGTARQIRLSRESFAQLPPQTASRFAILQSLHGTADVSYRVSNAPFEGAPVQFGVQGSFAGQVYHERLPRPLRDVQLAFHCDNSSLTVDSASAQFGEASLVGNFSRGGWQLESPCVVQFSASRFVLDGALRGALHGDWQRHWDRFAPEGAVNANVLLRFDGRRWLHSVTVDCLDGSFAYEKFPYRLRNVRGRIQCENDRILIGTPAEEIQGRAGGKLVKLHGEIANLGPNATGFVHVRTVEPIPLDERLIAALPDVVRHPENPRAKSPREVVRMLNPQGMIDIEAHYGRDKPTGPLEKRLDIRLLNGSVAYDQFKYPIYEIHGGLVMKNDHWRVEELRGANDSGVITCNGNWHPDGAGGCALDLVFQAWDVPLDDELREALRPSAQQVWQKLQPRGTVDTLSVALNYQSTVGSLDVRVRGHKGPAAGNIEGRSISVTPTWLPYQLDHVTGTFEMANGVATLQNVRGWHGASEFGFDGSAESPAEGAWRLRLDRVNASRVRVTHDLVAALPARWGNAISRLKLQGPLGVSGSLEVTGVHGEERPRTARWDLGVNLENGRVQCGVGFEHLRGEVGLAGQFGPGGVAGHGRLHIDSTVVKGVQLTEITGPLTFDAERLKFGSWADPAILGSDPRPLDARAFAGQVAVSGLIDFTSASFRLQTSLREGSLSAISQEATAGRHAISGRAFGALNLSGTSRGVHTLQGTGAVQLRDADIYELPLMFRLLKLLRIRDPDKTAFTSSDLEFHLVGDRIYFDRIDFDGDAISLEGKGELGFNRELNLTFDTSVGRDDSQLLSRVLRPILKEAGRRLVSIKVTGTLQDPHPETVALPELNEGIQQVFPETASGPRNTNSR